MIFYSDCKAFAIRWRYGSLILRFLVQHRSAARARVDLHAPLLYHKRDPETPPKAEDHHTTAAPELLWA